MKKNNQNEVEREFRENIYEESRPWGKFRSYPYKQACHVKIITVNSGSALSLQYHNRRSELWVVLDEGLEVTAGDDVLRPGQGEEIFIPAKAPHRLRCPGKIPARILEFWIGDPDEDDVIRIADDYGRG